MCTFIFAPNKEIEISYASETIKIEKPSKFVTITDLLITNKSDTPVKELYIIYPRKYLEFKRHSKTLYLPLLVLQVFARKYLEFNRHSRALQRVKFSDISQDILDEKSPNNRWFYDPGYFLPDKGKFDEDKGTPLTIRQPSVRQPLSWKQTEEPIPYDGFVFGRQVITEYEGLSPVQRKILSHIGYSVFTCSLEKPLRRDEPRWMRWKIQPENVAVEKRSRRKFFLDWFLNRLDFSYQLFGPISVLQRFRNGLKIFSETIDKDVRSFIEGKEESPGAVLSGEAQSLRGQIKELIDGSAVRIVDWRLFLFPNVYRRFDYVSDTGSCLRAGNFPDIVGYPFYVRIKQETVYQWLSGEVAGFKTPGEYSILVTAAAPNRFVRLIPWIALIIGILSILLRLLVK